MYTDIQVNDEYTLRESSLKTIYTIIILYKDFFKAEIVLLHISLNESISFS